MAMCVIPLSGVAPCQCFSPGGHETTSPGWISSTGPPQRCTKPRPAVTISVWPNGWVCQAARAPGSNVTLEPWTRPGALTWNNGSRRTLPVNVSFGPSLDDREPLLLMSMSSRLLLLDSSPKAGAVDHEPVADAAFGGKPSSTMVPEFRRRAKCPLMSCGALTVSTMRSNFP